MPLAKDREPQVAFRTPLGPEITAWALKHGVIKGGGPYSKPRDPDNPEANVSEALNILVRYALDHYDPSPDELTGGDQGPKLTDRDRQVLDHLREAGKSSVAVQGMSVDADRNVVSAQTARRLARLGLVTIFTGADGATAKLTEPAAAK